MVVGIIGATGLVGQTLVSILSDSPLPITLRFLTASSRSIGKRIRFRESYQIVENTKESSVSSPCDVVFIASSAAVSRKWRSVLLQHHRWVIDLSSAYRMDPAIPLPVPDIDSEVITQTNRWISNPNCSTIQLVKSLFPLYRHWGLHKVVVSTYQSVSGMGQAGIDRLTREEQGLPSDQLIPLHRNVNPWIGDITDLTNSEEEMKIIEETRKILAFSTLSIFPTAVRVPVPISHCESVYIETEKHFHLDAVKEMWQHTQGIVVSESPVLPTQTVGTNDVMISRIRSLSPCTLQYWVTADNIRVGSAWNAYQILQSLVEKGFLS